MDRQEKAKVFGALKRTVFLQEGIVQAFPVVVVIVFMITNIDFARNHLPVFLTLAIITTSLSTVIAALVYKFRNASIYSVLNAAAAGETPPPEKVIQAKKALLTFPLYSAGLVIFRWMVPPFFLIITPMIMMGHLELVSLGTLSFEVMCFATSIVCSAFYYHVAELNLRPILALDVFAGQKVEHVVKMSLVKKLGITLAFNVFYPIIVLLLMIFLSQHGVVDFSKNTLGVAVLIFCAVGMLAINTAAFAGCINKTMKELNHSIKHFSLGNISAIQNLSDTSVDEFGEQVTFFNTLSGNLKKRLNQMQSVGSGDLREDIEQFATDDELGEGLITMQKRLKEMVLKISEYSNDVYNGSQQTADASDVLSSGASQQAAVLEEISSSVTELNHKTQQNINNIIDSANKAEGSSGDAQRGNDEMKELKTAMEKIVIQAAEIKKIVKIIDDISFQINLLALNANVEAARAGKYGKGFAVVAEEVRNLANRSANSVSETNKVVEDTHHSIETVNRLVSSTATALETIEQNTKSVSTLLLDVKTSSVAQASGLKSITTALSEIDKVTQNNAASAEETSASAQELSSLARDLKEVSDSFKLE